MEFYPFELILSANDCKPDRTRTDVRADDRCNTRRDNVVGRQQMRGFFSQFSDASRRVSVYDCHTLKRADIV
jgi:hypothetical protein